MAKEGKLQSEIAAYLRELGFFVMVIQPQAGIPSGVSDIFFCKRRFYGWIEVKSRYNAPFQPLQKDFIEKMNSWSYARVVYPENWEYIKHEIATVL